MRVNVSSEMDVRRGGRFVSDLAASACLGCGRVFLYVVHLDRVREVFGSGP
uniref:hypothetical protein n=1 Tax=Nonomuraea pusilla TaxID=46177 RepID=UPI00159C41CA|nr:hypothetical protein [Nonomuraea pusilla]